MTTESVAGTTTIDRDRVKELTDRELAKLAERTPES